MRGNLLLAFVAGLTLVMPVSYRAGTERAHPHATIQLWIDATTGHSHHHDEIGHAGTKPHSRYVLADTADIALNVARSDGGHDTFRTLMSAAQAGNGMLLVVGDDPVTIQSDSAETLPNTMPLQFSNVLGVLGLLVALMAMLSDGGRWWAETQRLSGIIRPMEPPPPRGVPALTHEILGF